MPFKIENPNWKTPVRQKAEQHAPAVAAWLQANAANRYVTIAEMRGGLSAIAGDLTRPVINEICNILGLNVEGADDKTP